MEDEKGPSREEEEFYEARKKVAEKAETEIGPYERAFALESRIRQLDDLLDAQLKEISYLRDWVQRLKSGYQDNLRLGLEPNAPEMKHMDKVVQGQELDLGKIELEIVATTTALKELNEESKNAEWKPAPAEDGDTTPAENSDLSAEASAEVEEPTKE